jgi:hypothetical protein
MNAVLEGKVVCGLINDVVVVRDSGGGRVHVKKMRKKIRKNIQRSEKGPAGKRPRERQKTEAS